MLAAAPRGKPTLTRRLVSSSSTEPARRPVGLRSIAAAGAVQRGDVLQRHQDVPVQLDVGDVLDRAVRGQHTFLVLAAEERQLDLLALVLVRVVLHAAGQSTGRSTVPRTRDASTWQLRDRAVDEPCRTGACTASQRAAVRDDEHPSRRDGGRRSRRALRGLARELLVRLAVAPARPSRATGKRSGSAPRRASAPSTLRNPSRASPAQRHAGGRVCAATTRPSRARGARSLA